jgi:hypothetical protein
MAADAGTSREPMVAGDSSHITADRSAGRRMGWNFCVSTREKRSMPPSGFPRAPGTVLGGVYNGGKGGRENLMKRIWKLTSASIVFMLVIAMSSTSSFALETTEAEARAACTWDVFRFCFSAMPNLDLIIVCLEREKQNISKPCQAVLSANGH